MDGDHSKDVGRQFRDVYGTVREVRAAVLALGLASDLAERAALVASELATNAVLHARCTPYVRIWYGGGLLRLEVTDQSDVLPLAASTGGAVSAPPAASGWGLHIVNAFSKSWGSRRRLGGKVVWAELE